MICSVYVLNIDSKNDLSMHTIWPDNNTILTIGYSVWNKQIYINHYDH